jgi:hypothetical protein
MSEFDNYSAVIFWDFKRMDNVNYNFKIVDKLIESSLNSDEKKLFYKPIYLILSSIIECTLYDFLKKINQHRYEHIPNLGEEEVKAIQNMEVPNKLNCFNKICKKYLFLGADEAIYEKIQHVAEIRNRIHIQNGKGNKPYDESFLWKTPLIKECGQLLKDIFVLMCEKYPRPDRFHDNPIMDSFPQPWEKL